MRGFLFVILLSLFLVACPREVPVVVAEPAVTADATVEVAPADPALTAAPVVMPRRGPHGDCEAAICASLKPLPDDVKTDDRLSRRRHRVRKLLKAEVRNLKRLLDALAPDDAYRPTVLLRLAEGYVELARSLEDSDAQGSEDARKDAIVYYDIVLEGYPGWCQSPDQSPGGRVCPDEFSYRKALEQERLGTHAEACATFRAVAESSELPRLRGLACRGLSRVRQQP